jgi:hypothetical protein
LGSNSELRPRNVQPDVRALHGTTGWRQQRSGSDDPRRNTQRQIVGNHARRPDGVDEYFVRKGHPVYVPDQVTRARSGFNQSSINNVLAGNAPPNTLPNILRLSDEIGWQIFRFGPTFGQAYPDEQFPIESSAKNEHRSLEVLDLRSRLGQIFWPLPRSYALKSSRFWQSLQRPGSPSTSARRRHARTRR